MNHSGHVGHHHVMEPISVDHMDHEAHSGQMNQVDHSGHMGMQVVFCLFQFCFYYCLSFSRRHW